MRSILSKNFIIIILLLLSVQNSNQLRFDIFESFSLISKILNPSGFVFQLIKLRLADMEEDFACTLIKRIVEAVVPQSKKNIHQLKSLI